MSIACVETVLPHGTALATPSFGEVVADYPSFRRTTYVDELKPAYAAARKYLAGPPADFSYVTRRSTQHPSSAPAVASTSVRGVAVAGPSTSAGPSLEAWLGEVVGEDAPLAAALRSVGITKPSQILGLRTSELDTLLAAQELVGATSVVDRILLSSRVRPLLSPAV